MDVLQSTKLFFSIQNLRQRFTYTQWAAVMTQSAEMTLPPQKWKLLLLLRIETCQGHAPGAASIPPMIGAAISRLAYCLPTPQTLSNGASSSTGS